MEKIKEESLSEFMINEHINQLLNINTLEELRELQARLIKSAEELKQYHNQYHKEQQNA